MPSGRTVANRVFNSSLTPGGATNPASSPFGVGNVGPIYTLGSQPAVSGGIAAFSGSGATAANADGSYVGTDGKLRNADGSRKVGGATLAARGGKSWWSDLSTGAKVAIIGGSVALLVVYIAYRKATAPLRYANRIAAAAKGVHKAVTGG